MCRQVVTIIISLCALMVHPAFASVPRGVNLSNMSNWDIIIAEDAFPSEIYAAEEFQSYFTQASNIQLPIVRKANPATNGQNHIFIGSNPAMRTSTAFHKFHDYATFRFVAKGLPV